MLSLGDRSLVLRPELGENERPSLSTCDVTDRSHIRARRSRNRSEQLAVKKTSEYWKYDRLELI